MTVATTLKSNSETVLCAIILSRTIRGNLFLQKLIWNDIANVKQNVNDKRIAFPMINNSVSTF